MKKIHVMSGSLLVLMISVVVLLASNPAWAESDSDFIFSA